MSDLKLKVGDKVRYIREKIFHSHEFKIGDIMTIIEVYGTDVQYKCESERGKHINWFTEKEIELVEFDICETKIADPKCNCIAKNWTIGVDTATSSSIKEREVNKMNCEKILKIFKKSEMEAIKESYEIQKTEILEKDELYNVENELVNQVNILLENDGQEKGLEPLSTSPRYLLRNTRELLKDLEKQETEEIEKLNKMLVEVEAMLEIAPDYETTMKILERYDVIDKKTKMIKKGDK